MEKVVRIVKKGKDDSNLLYWLSLTPIERLAQLEIIRQEYIKAHYDESRQGLQRVYCIVKRK